MQDWYLRRSDEMNDILNIYIYMSDVSIQPVLFRFTMKNNGWQNYLANIIQLYVVIVMPVIVRLD